jgi:hypothetical protein
MKKLLIVVASILIIAVAGYKAAVNFEIIPSVPEGIIASSAKFQSKAKQSEAKILLAGAYTQFMMDQIDSDTGKYTVNSLTRENTKGQNYKILSPGTDESKKYCPDCLVGPNAFKIVIVGNIDKDETIDVWTIDNDKKIINVVNDSEL